MKTTQKHKKKHKLNKKYKPELGLDPSTHIGGKNKDWLLTVPAEREPLSIKEECVFGARWRVSMNIVSTSQNQRERAPDI